MDNLKKELNRYGEHLRQERCPLTDAELSRAIRHATWQEPAAEPTPDLADPAGVPIPLAAKLRHKWPWVAAAACLAALLIPLARTDSPARKHPQNGMTFVCNNGCQSQEILTRLDNIIK